MAMESTELKFAQKREEILSRKIIDFLKVILVRKFNSMRVVEECQEQRKLSQILMEMPPYSSLG